MILLDPSLRTEQLSNPNPRIDAPAIRPLPSVRNLTAYLRTAQTAVRLRGQVSVLLTTDKEIRRLNRLFRGKNKATDVLSFPAEPGPEKLAGDLAISVPTAAGQAAAQGHPLAVELKILILHGLLHLAGYDHETDQGQMARRERTLRAKLRLPLGLIERTSVPILSPGLARKGGQSRSRLGEEDSRRKVTKSGKRRPAGLEPLGAGRDPSPARARSRKP